MKSKEENGDSESSAHVNNFEKSLNNQQNGKNVLSSQNNESLCTQEKLELSSWGLPEKVLEFYRKKGIIRMFQWQLECLTLGGVLDAGNLVYSAPTSAGKTLVAEILISKTVFELQKKALVILPFVSVVREKMFYFQSMYASSGIHVEGYMGGHSPSIPFKQVHVAVCTIEKANSIINKLLEEQSLQNLGLVVVDELHLLGDPYRGYLLELLLTKLKYISSKSEFKVQIVGMSATLPNLKSLADWLNADLYYTDFRPVPLNEKLKCGTIIYDKKLSKLSELTPLPSEGLDDSENVGQLCLDTIANGHSVLIFCPTKVWCENLADKISMFFRKNGCSKSAEVEGTPGWILRKQINLKKINEVIEHLKMCPVGLDKDLQRTVSYGVAFHHAGLTLDERDIIEGSFRQGSLRVLCATSTLSSGVNLPARRVIIRSPMSFGGLMDVLTYRQMIGRAGRMGVDSEGESILICKPNEKALCQTLMCSNLKPIESCLGHGRLSASLKRALLEIIASGIASNPEEIEKYASCTFLASSSRHNIEDPIQSCLEFLEENEFIRLQENGTLYIPTPLGKACLASSLPPDEGLALFRELQRARRCFVLDTDLHIIYQVTPYSVSEQWSKVDWLNVLNTLEGLPPSMKRVGELVGVEESFLVRVVKGSINPNDQENRNKLSIHRRFYTSLALQDLVNEVPLSEVAEKYECNKGMLQSLQQSAATYAGMVTEFTKRLGWGSVELIFSQFQERLQFGIQRELCELMRLPLLNAMRARALFNAGFTSLSAIASADASELENAFLAMVPFQSKKQIAGETTYDKEQRNKLETVWITGKADLSIREAAEQLLMESRNILQMELGLEGAQWGKKSVDKSVLDESNFKSVNYSSANKTGLRESNVGAGRSNSENKKNDIAQNTVISQEKVKENILENQKSAVIEHVNHEIKLNGDLNNLNKSSDTVNLINCNNKSINSPKSELLNEINNQCIEESQKVNGVASNAEESIDKKLKGTESVSPKEDVNNVFNKSETHELNDSDKFIKGRERGAFTLEKEEIDYFATSFNCDMISEYETSERNEIQLIAEIKEFSRDKVVDNISSEVDSNDSVEILFDSTIHSGTKNLSFSRLSEDMFDISKRGGENSKKMSTPISSHGHRNVRENEFSRSRLGDTRSPDLFSQSLTFDTQLGKILDFEDHPGGDVQVVVNPSSSLNSDDLGFVSDLSPPKPQGNQKTDMGDKKIEKKNLDAGTSASITEKVFKSPLKDGIEDKLKEQRESIKRKANAIDSPDVIVETPGSVVRTHHTSKRIKFGSKDGEIIDLASPVAIVSNDSDDEIMPTPKMSKNYFLEPKVNKLSNSSIRSIDRESSIRKVSQRKKTKSLVNEQINEVKVSKNDTTKMDKPNWDKINVIDVCGNEQEFRFFCDELKEQNIVGLALGCRRKAEEKRNIIGARISRRISIDNKKESLSKCTYKDIVLDGIAFYWKGNDVFYMSLDNGNVPLDDKISLIKYLCLSKKTLRVYDAKEQMKMFQRCSSILLTSSYQDPKIGSWLLSENWKERNFSALTLEYLPAAKNLVSLIGTVVGYSSPGLLVKSCVSHKTRATLEAFLIYHVINKQISLLQEKGLLKAFENVEMPIMVSLAEMELAGFQICRNRIVDINAKLDEVKETLEEKAYSLAGHKFSISSSAAVNKVLFKELGLDKSNVALTKKRKVPSTSKQALQELANETNHPLPEIILQWRKIKSISSKFVSHLLQISSESTRVFGVSQSFTVTGRISMHEPNLQNIPKNFVLNFEGNDPAVVSINLREVFVASENCVLLSADYCQIELRILAHLSQDKELIKNICDSSDIFVNIASTIFGVSCYEVDDVLRQRAKQTCYGIIYGVGPQTLSQQLEIDESDAVKLMEDFKSKYQGVQAYLEQTVSECKRKGFVSTLMGRRRYLPAINDANPAIKSEAERQAVNTTIQGSAADLVKIALIAWREGVDELVSDGVIARLVLHLHDELIFEVQQNVVDTVAIILKDVMENAMSLSVPFPVKLRTGPSWGELESFEL